MSMIICSSCGALCDCDEYPEGFYRYTEDGISDEPSDEYYCVMCNEEDDGIIQQQEATVSADSFINLIESEAKRHLAQEGCEIGDRIAWRYIASMVETYRKDAKNG